MYYQIEYERVPEESRKPSWRPVWLRQSTLIGFTSLFFALFLGLILINIFMTLRDGFSFSMTDESNPYPWTYGPTIILVIVVAFWRRVGYCVLISQPWLELQRSPSGQPAAVTVLLDYMWPLQITSFIRALRNRHIAVVMSITVFAMLKASIVVSTTLFLPDDSTFTLKMPVAPRTEFNAGRFWSTVQPQWKPRSQLTQSDSVPEIRDPEEEENVVLTDPVWQYIALLRQYPDGDVPADLAIAFTTSAVVSEMPNGSPEEVTASSKFMTPDVACEVASASLDDSNPGPHKTLKFDAASCGSGSVQIDMCGIGGRCHATQKSFAMWRVNCTDSGIRIIDAFPVDDYQPDMPNTYRYIIAAAEVTWSQDAKMANDTNQTFRNEWQPVNSQRLAVVSCRMNYSLSEGLVRGPPSSISRLDMTSRSDTTGKGQSQIANLTSIQLSEATFESMTAASQVLFMRNMQRQLAPEFIQEYHTQRGMTEDSVLLELLSLHTPQDLDALLQVQSLRNIAQNTLSGLSQQFMRFYCLRSTDNATTMYKDIPVVFTQRRLHRRGLALWALVGLFAIMSGLTLVIFGFSKSGIVPSSPAFLLTHASVLNDSPHMIQLLHHASPIQDEQLHEVLKGYQFSAAGLGQTGRLCIKSSANRHTDPPAAALTPPSPPWMPWSARRHATVLTITMPLVSILVLETLWRVSEARHGFTVSSDTSVAAYAVRYGSTAIGLLIATLYNSLEFSITAMTPFSVLAKGGSAKQTVSFSIIEQLPPIALWKAIRGHHYGAVLSLIAAMIGSLLTIIISGLWVWDPQVSLSTPVSSKIMSGWNADFSYYPQSATPIRDKAAAELFDSIEHGFRANSASILNNNTVLPLIEVPSQPHQASKHTHSQSYTLTVPAIQPRLECSPTSIYWDDKSGLHAEYRVTSNCVRGHQYGVTVKTSGRDHESSSWMGYIFHDGVSTSFPTAPGVSCPSFGAVFAYWHNMTAVVPENYMAIVCTQRLQLVEADVTYYTQPQNTSSSSNSSPHTALVPTNVKVRPESAINLVDPVSGVASLRYDFSSALSWLTTGYEIGWPSGLRSFDAAFSHIVDGDDGTRPEEITDTTRLIQALNNIYQKYMVHVVDMNYRVDISNTSVPHIEIPGYENGEPAKGEFVEVVSRLRMSRISKTVLQAMLSAMMVLGSLAYYLTDMRNTGLPGSPFSIASIMALFAGGGVQRTGKGEGEEVEGEIIYRLGWWDEEDEEGEDTSDGNDSDTTSRLPTRGEKHRKFGIYTVPSRTIPKL